MTYLFLPMPIVDRLFFLAFSQLGNVKNRRSGTDEAITYSVLRMNL